MADLVIALLQNYAAAATLFPAGPADAAAAAAELPEPMLPHNWDGAAGACLHEESLHTAALPGAQSVWILLIAAMLAPLWLVKSLGTAANPQCVLHCGSMQHVCCHSAFSNFRSSPLQRCAQLEGLLSAGC